MGTDDAFSTMSEQQCWDFLRSKQFGRLAFAIGDEVFITPINYVAGQDQLVFRTAQGNKLFGVTVSHHVAFEVDEIADMEARSVIVRGHARVLEGHEAEAAEELPLRPWVPTLKYNVVAISADEVTGREFHLGEEPPRY